MWNLDDDIDMENTENFFDMTDFLDCVAYELNVSSFDETYIYENEDLIKEKVIETSYYDTILFVANELRK